jgi:hypothetical protein
MRTFRCFLIVSILGLLLLAPAASAQPSQPLDATYMVKIVGPAGHPPCPGGASACGGGSDSLFGAFTYSSVGTAAGFTTTLTFATGVLVIDETFQLITPTNSGLQGPYSHGHPVTALVTWSVDPTSSGAFSGATGNGTDVAKVAGEQGKGVIAGTVNLS